MNKRIIAGVVMTIAPAIAAPAFADDAVYAKFPITLPVSYTHLTLPTLYSV